MSAQLNVGIVGTSNWTAMMFLPTISSHPSAKITAICGRNRTRGEALAQTFAIPQVFTDHRTMITEGNLDAIVIASPDDLHYEMTMAALDAGLHVLCEKPMALTVEHAQEMTTRVEAAGVKHMVLFTWRWLAHFQYLKQLVEKGYLGRCYQANFRFMSGFGRNSQYSWRRDGTRSNGVVSDLGAHMIDFAHWFVGDIARINANLRTHLVPDVGEGQPTAPANDAADIALQFANGAQGMIQVSTLAHQADRLMEIIVELYGEKGTLTCRFIPQGRQAGMTLQGARQDEETFTTMELPEVLSKSVDDELLASFKHESIGPRHFIDAIVQDFPALPNFQDGLKVQKIIGAALESAREGSWISI